MLAIAWLSVLHAAGATSEAIANTAVTAVTGSVCTWVCIRQSYHVRGCGNYACEDSHWVCVYLRLCMHGSMSNSLVTHQPVPDHLCCNAADAT